MPHVKVRWQDSCHDSKTLVHKQNLKKLLFPPGSFTSQGGGAGGGVTAPSSCPWPRGGGTPSPGWTHPGGSTRAPRWVMNIPLMSVEIYGRRTIVLVSTILPSILHRPGVGVVVSLSILSLVFTNFFS